MPAKAFARTFAFAALSLASAIPLHAETPLGGLTVAVSGDGKRLVAAGDTRTLLVLDPDKLTVTQRIFIGTTVTRLGFDKTGNTLVVGDTDGAVLLFDAQTWKQRAALARRFAPAIARETGLLAAADSEHSPTAIAIADLASGADRTKIPLAKDDKISALGFDAPGRRIAVLFGPKDDKDEPKLQYSQIPKELRGLERDEFQQKNDGQSSLLRIYDATSGAMLSERKLYYTLQATGSHLLFDGDSVIVNNYNNLGARIGADGSVALYKNSNGFNYGSGMLAAQTTVYGGGLRSFAIVDPKTLKDVKGEIDKLPGWPEYFKGFSATDNGAAIYGATTGYRVIRMTPDGKVSAAAPVM